jgi:hypothetical protein
MALKILPDGLGGSSGGNHCLNLSAEVGFAKPKPLHWVIMATFD